MFKRKRVSGKKGMEKVVKELLEEGEEFIDPQKELNDESSSAYRCKIKNRDYTVCFIIEDKFNRISIVMSSNYEVPEEKRAEAAEYIMRANYRIAVGDFLMDFEDGNFIYRSTMMYDWSMRRKYLKRLLKELFSQADTEMFYQLSHLKAVISGEKDPSISRGELSLIKIQYPGSKGEFPVPV